ncbi:aminotransferase class IV [Ruegeria sp. 2012CJ41-6]|uniref:Probable branched-chain-amino-acid aminotransferase n=1 Tax=Ruegeria spongiae TaxID=2942209 RepID=A0ABT0Q2T3_9RHOB|nr:aminotransferase class IV [Ruegeria spongiae]MCL6284186.1 aminotransferase class IV [Ruegeria spongiae]
MSFTDYIFTEYNKRTAALAQSDNPYARGVAWVDGEFAPLHDARIPILDQGFLHSDLTYDVPAVWDGRFFRLDDHLDRFEASIAKLRMRNPLSRKDMRAKLIEMVAMSGIRDAYVQMILTRGLQFIRQSAPEDCKNCCYLMVMPYVWVMGEELQRTGGHAIVTRNVRRIPAGAIDPTIKNLQWGDFTRGLLEARDRGAMYPMLTDGDGNITEGSGFNVVFVKDQHLFTARKGVLEGVTRKTVLEISDRLGFAWTLDDVPVELAYTCDECFFVTTAGGVMPVTRIDGNPVGNGEAGTVTKALWKGYWDTHYDPELSFAIEYRRPR